MKRYYSWPGDLKRGRKDSGNWSWPTSIVFTRSSDANYRHMKMLTMYYRILFESFSHLDGFEGRSELYTWMYRIAQNEVFNFDKRNAKMKMVVLENQVEKREEPI
jgi:hypothetical protein